MSQTSQPHTSPAWRARRVPPSLRIEASAALVGPEAGDPLAAGRRFVQSAPGYGIDLDLMFATIDAARTPAIGQVALAVIGAGRTAMMFVSGDRRVADDHTERVAVIEHACAEVRSMGPDLVKIAQALPEPDQADVAGALVDADFHHVGDLAYLKRAITREDRVAAAPELPSGVHVRAVSNIDRGRPDRLALADALEQSYVDTLDCPELCGVRDVHDVIDSHQAAGKWRADLWKLVYEHDVVRGCMLLNHNPDIGAVELVYLGLAPSLRGRGVAATLLQQAIPPISRLGADSLQCAVDRRNAPALRVYGRLGFSEFSARRALVRAL